MTRDKVDFIIEAGAYQHSINDEIKVTTN